MKTLVIATHNEGKAKEFASLLKGFDLSIISAASLGLPEPEETGASFAENASIKSESAARLSGNFALADDSGLCIPALGDAPGIYSARWAGPKKDFTMAFERIQNELLAKKLSPQGVAAYFICVLSLTSPDSKTQHFEGRVDGTLTFPPRGTHGFGYDSIFVPAGYQQTFAEMSPQDKHKISHRARAFGAFTDFIARKKAS